MTTMDKEAMNQYIDEKITGEERAIMQEVLLQLDPEDRKNVIYIDDNNNVYATNDELRNSIVHYSLNSEGLYENSQGTTLSPSVDTQSVVPLAETGHGPYRRVTSATGKSWMSIYVYLPDTSNVYVPESGVNTPYAYIGGTYKSGTTEKEVDAGMMFNKGLKNWSLFLRANGTTEDYAAARMKAGQKVFLKYYVTSANNVAVKVTGTRYDNNAKDEFTLVRSGVTGWNTAGTNCSLKHVVSIAQGNQENFSSGAYLKNVTWSEGRIGTSSTNNSAWTSVGSNPITYPNSQKVIVSYTNAGNETDTINLA